MFIFQFPATIGLRMIIGLLSAVRAFRQAAWCSAHAWRVMLGEYRGNQEALIP
jgi:hypothetical protein